MPISIHETWQCDFCSNQVIFPHRVDEIGMAKRISPKDWTHIRIRKIGDMNVDLIGARGSYIVACQLCGPKLQVIRDAMPEQAEA